MLDELTDDVRKQLYEVVAEAVEERNRQQSELIQRMAEQIRLEIRNFEYRAKNCLIFAAEQESARTSARFMLEHLAAAKPFPHQFLVFDHALRCAADQPGMALEFGVFKGGTLRVVADARQGRDVYGFDSFDGLPEDWRAGFAAGHFALSADGLPRVPGATLVKGWFDETLPGFLAEHPGPVAFVHVDSDLYSSAKTVLTLLRPRLVPGTVIVFDEFYNYPGWEAHEYRAWTEFVEETGIGYEYLAYAPDGWNVAVRITG